METTTRLYALNYSELRTYLWAGAFIGCNIVLPQLFHLIPQGGIIFAPLSLVILFGAYKFGWKVGLLAALASPLVNHALFGQPTWEVMSVMAVKLAALAIAAGFAAQYFKRASLTLLACVVLLAELTGGLAELAFTQGIGAIVADFTIGIPGLLLQVFGTYFLINKVTF